MNKTKKKRILNGMIAIALLTCVSISLYLYFHPTVEALSKKLIEKCKNIHGEDEVTFCECMSYKMMVMYPESIFKEYVIQFDKNPEKASALLYSLNATEREETFNTIYKSCFPKQTFEHQIDFIGDMIYKTIGNEEFTNCMVENIKKLPDSQRNFTVRTIQFGDQYEREQALQFVGENCLYILQ